MASLKPEKELALFFNELLSTFDISITDDLINGKNEKSLRDRLSQASFSSYLNFIGSFSVIIK